MADKCEMQFQGESRWLAATANIRQGETIISLPQVTQPDADRYSVEAAPGIHIDCSFCPLGAVNHSCDPNAVVRDFRVVAWRCIEEGEEITLDFKRTEDTLDSPFDCTCGHCPPGTRIE